MIRVLVVLAAVGATPWVHAHPEIEHALSRLNAEIATQPANADLFVQRGELYARHLAWDLAEANYLRAAELAPDHPRLALARAVLELATGRAAEALPRLNAAIERNAADAEALVLRARALATLNPSQAIVDYNAALARLATPGPELFLERAALLPAAHAIRSLDEALTRLGSVVSLELRALELEESVGRIDAAARRLERLAKQSERPELWLKRQGDLFARAHRTREAQAAYAAALSALASLPDWLRTSPEVARLTATLTPLATPLPESR